MSRIVIKENVGRRLFGSISLQSQRPVVSRELFQQWGLPFASYAVAGFDLSQFTRWGTGFTFDDMARNGLRPEHLRTLPNSLAWFNPFAVKLLTEGCWTPAHLAEGKVTFAELRDLGIDLAMLVKSPEFTCAVLRVWTSIKIEEWGKLGLRIDHLLNMRIMREDIEAMGWSWDQIKESLRATTDDARRLSDSLEFTNIPIPEAAIPPVPMYTLPPPQYAQAQIPPQQPYTSPQYGVEMQYSYPQSAHYNGPAAVSPPQPPPSGNRPARVPIV